ncbi:MAG TPA: DUF6084 family protein, partial [Candidatus Sulfopaludibacter sp.]|nr:DUF6084 family protein [Candidatus Sulfopaludibacter sp.]
VSSSGCRRLDVPDLSFLVEGAEPIPFSTTPMLGIRLAIQNRPPQEEIRSINLQCQIRIEPARRTYTGEEQKRLLDLFGEPERWSRTLHSMLWTQAAVLVPPFQGVSLVELPVACTFDLTVATAKYFNGLEEGSVSLTLLFSGSVFYNTEEGDLQVVQIPWTQEAAYALPVSVWKRLMDAYYPNTAWLGLRRDVFERLHRYKTEHGIPTWEETLESMLP